MKHADPPGKVDDFFVLISFCFDWGLSVSSNRVFPPRFRPWNSRLVCLFDFSFNGARRIHERFYWAVPLPHFVLFLSLWSHTCKMADLRDCCSPFALEMRANLTQLQILRSEWNTSIRQGRLAIFFVLISFCFDWGLSVSSNRVFSPSISPLKRWSSSGAFVCSVFFSFNGACRINKRFNSAVPLPHFVLFLSLWSRTESASFLLSEILFFFFQNRAAPSVFTAINQFVCVVPFFSDILFFFLSSFIALRRRRRWRMEIRPRNKIWRKKNTHRKMDENFGRPDHQRNAPRGSRPIRLRET